MLFEKKIWFNDKNFEIFREKRNIFVNLLKLEKFTLNIINQVFPCPRVAWWVLNKYGVDTRYTVLDAALGLKKSSFLLLCFTLQKHLFSNDFKF